MCLTKTRNQIYFLNMFLPKYIEKLYNVNYIYINVFDKNM